MSVDSSAVFSDRVHQLGLGDHLEAFNQAGWHTYADVAFSTSYLPGQPEDARFANDILVRGLGQQDHKDKDKLRRLFFEAYSLASADMSRLVSASSDDIPRKVPNVEREERRRRLADRLVGVNLSGELDVSNRLIDINISMYDENVLRQNTFEECTKRAIAWRRTQCGPRTRRAT